MYVRQEGDRIFVGLHKSKTPASDVLPIILYNKNPSSVYGRRIDYLRIILHKLFCAYLSNTLIENIAFL